MTKSAAKKTKLLEGLNSEQLEAVTHDRGPLLIVAGAGTGKTTVITRRIAWLIEQNLAKPEEILALTFTEKAAGEMEERVDKLLPYGYLNLWISTFHAFGKRILEAHAFDIGLPVNFRQLASTDLWVLMRQNLDRFDLDYYRPLGNPSRFLHALISHFSRAKDELITPAEYEDYARSLQLAKDSDVGGEASLESKRVAEIAKAYAIYQKILSEEGALDFGDLINITYRLFQERPNILARYRGQFKYILIDEFQDTNLAQFELIKMLSSPANNITVVGDDDQSIYKFRGASVSNILKFQDIYPKAKKVTLIQNYRSHQNLLDLSYSFIQANNPDRLEVKLKIDKKLVAVRPGKSSAGVIQYRDYHQEAAEVVSKIQALKQADADLVWSDFAVLVRANDTAGPVLEYLDAAQVPYIQLSRRGLYRKPVVADILSYFKLLDNYHESRALFRALNLPKFKFQNDDIARILDFGHRKTYSTYESLKQPALLNSLSSEAKKSVQELLALMEKHTSLSRAKPIGELFVAVVADLGLAAENPDSLEAAQRLDYLDQLHRKIKDFAAGSSHKLLKDYMSELELELAAGETGELDFDPDIGPEAVKLMTVHSAKGLEFKHVFLVGLADKKFPAIGRSDPIELPEKLIRDILPAGDFHLQEERRLFYVAMTRARDALHFSFAADYGGTSVRKPSIFLKEIGLPSRQAPSPAGRDHIVQEKQRQKAAYPVPKSFNFTSVSEFRKCPLEYKFRYVLKVPEAGAAQLSFGQTIHRTLENFLKLYKQQSNAEQGDLFGKPRKKTGRKFPPFQAMSDFYKAAWVDEWYEDKKQKEDYRSRGMEMLKSVYENFSLNIPTPKYIEKQFKLSLGKYLFTGKIDRADETPGGLRIIDYKTGAGRPLEKVDRQQLLIYQWAAQDFLREEVAQLEYWYLKDRLDIKSFSGTQEQIAEMKQWLLEIINRIIEATQNDSFELFHKQTGKHDCRFERL